MKEGGRPHVYGRKRKKEEELGLRGTLFLSQYGVGSRRKGKRRELVLVCLLLNRRKTLPGLELGGLSGSLPSGYSPTTRCSALLACLLSWLVQDSAPSPPPPFFIYPQMPSLTLASPPPRSCLLSVCYPTSPLKLWMI